MLKKNFPAIIFFITLTMVSAIVFFVFSKKITVASNESITITVKISVCGNGEKEYGEDCDNDDLGGASCASQGFASGDLTCTATCDFNTSQCRSAAPTPAPSSGGGGGGSIPLPTPTPITQVTFKGMAYPLGDVTLLKDAQVAAITKAGADAKFEISLSGISGGVYIFSIWAEDKKGLRSITHTFSIAITGGATTMVSGIFLPPTISLDKIEVRRGEPLNIMGYGAPKAEIVVFINSEEGIVKKTVAQTDGGWFYSFDTLEVDYGDHTTRARSSLNGSITTFSKALSFKVGEKNIAAEPKAQAIKGDSNGDSRVNLVDFSILAYWYKRPLPPKKVDLNGDGKVDLIDFSIMAYYWTG